MNKEYFKEIIEFIKKNNPSKEDLAREKIKLCKKHKVKKIPTDIQVLLNATPNDLKEINIVTKPTRTISGVSVVAIMSHPFKCPHGKCSMCPSNLEKGIPMSYTGNEPATMRGVRNDFDPYLQVFNRIEQYVVLGQSFDKIELIIMGGTFPSFEKSYQETFVTDSFGAMNDFSENFFTKKGVFQIQKFRDFFLLPADVRDNDKTREKTIKKKLLKLKHEKTRSLEEEKKKNETSHIKCVGLTVETRPDYANLVEGNELLKLGCTRIELGIQSVYDEALEIIDRGHSVQQSIDSIRTLKNLGFKLNFHMMPGLPGISEEKDLEGLKELFKNKDFRPDMIKLYPCMVIPKTKLFEDFKKGKFTPLTTKESAKIIADFKPFIEPYCRIMRIQRDIPTYKTTAGVDKTNLRQEIDKLKSDCKCIRCREVGHVKSKRGLIPKNVEIRINEYDASNGKEFFISAEDFDQDILLGFCRLRFPNVSLREEITKDSAIIRELHVYGEAVTIGKKEESSIQHKGWGKKLLEKAESIAKQNNKNKMLIISGVGVRKYYKKFGYELEGPYMTKQI